MQTNDQFDTIDQQVNRQDEEIKNLGSSLSRFKTLTLFLAVISIVYVMSSTGSQVQIQSGTSLVASSMSNTALTTAVRSLNQKVRALKGQVSALTNRVNANSSSQISTPSNVIRKGIWQMANIQRQGRAFIGRVEKKVSGNWHPSCDDQHPGKAAQAAAVFCRSLNMSSTGSVWYTNKNYGTKYGSSSKKMISNGWNCKGTEASLSQCSASSYKRGHCSSGEQVYAKCQPKSGAASASSTRSSYRLSNARRYRVGGKPGILGRVEKQVGTNWHPSCDDLHSGNAALSAKVLCRSLGYNNTAGAKWFTNANYGAKYGKSKNTMISNGWSCKGTEKSLDQCTKSSYARGHCNTNEQVYAFCPTGQAVAGNSSRVSNANSTFTSGSYRLTNAKRFGGGIRGRVEFKYGGVWRPSCDDNHGANNNSAKVLCKSVKLPYTRAIWYYDGNLGNSLGRSKNSMAAIGWKCKGNENSLSQCARIPYTKNHCNPREQAYALCR